MLRSTGFVALAIALMVPAPAHASGGFEDHFDPEYTLRVEVVRDGDATSEAIALRGLVREGPWAGSRTQLLDTTGYGKHRVLVRPGGDAAAAPLYTRGYCSVFGEWQTTAEARAGRRRAFDEALRIPYPREAVDVIFETRDSNGRFSEVGRMRVDPASDRIAPVSAPAHEVIVLAESGPPSEKLDVLVLAEGYTEAELGKFRRDVERFSRAFFAKAPFSDRRSDINLRAVAAPSRESGTDEPRKGLYRDTAVGTAFDTFGSARYLTTVETRRMYDIAAAAPYDTLVILVNTSRYGGAGIFGLYAVFPSDNEFDEYVFLHELGHSFGGLGDEYYSSSVAYEGFYPEGVEPWEPNVTALADPRHPKWRDLIDEGVPCPTPEDRERYGELSVGCFEGAGYQAKGLYRPTIDSMMFSKGDLEFGPVNARALEAMINLYAGR